jgi:hypothetical protein
MTDASISLVIINEFSFWGVTSITKKIMRIDVPKFNDQKTTILREY